MFALNPYLLLSFISYLLYFTLKFFNFLQENESAAKIAKAANLRKFSESHRLTIDFSVGSCGCSEHDWCEQKTDLTFPRFICHSQNTFTLHYVRGKVKLGRWVQNHQIYVSHNSFCTNQYTTTANTFMLQNETHADKT